MQKEYYYLYLIYENFNLNNPIYLFDHQCNLNAVAIIKLNFDLLLINFIQLVCFFVMSIDYYVNQMGLLVMKLMEVQLYLKNLKIIWTMLIL
jgi:hypothetical protein